MPHKLQGKAAPDFKLSDSSGTEYSLEDFTGKFMVVFFYPKDDTPGCTIESKSFSKNLKKFSKLETDVVGISGGDDKSKAKFCTKYKLKTLMLSDSDFSLAKKYKCYGEKSFMGKKYLGILRNTYVLDAKRKVVRVFEGVNPLTHVGEVLEYLSTLG